MKQFDKLQKSIGKKLTLHDYKTEKQQEVSTAKQEKVKITVYLDEDTIRKFNEICSRKVLENGKPDKSSLICKAINLLYEKEK